ncbi:MAG: AMP-binding protein [Acidobacteriota bacterium]
MTRGSAAPFDLAAAARALPARTAVLDPADGALSYAQLAQRVAATIAALRVVPAIAAAPDEPAPAVTYVDDRSLDALVLTHALLAMGAPAAPLHPRWTAIERDAFRGCLRAAMPTADVDPSVIAAAADGHVDATLPPAPVDDDRPLAILATSGSQGVPKAVVLSRAAFAAAVAASARRLPWPDDAPGRWLLGLTLAHVGGLSIVLRCLAARRTVVVRRGAFDAAAVRDFVAHHRVDRLSLVPTMLARLVDDGAAPPPSVALVLLGGADAPATLRRRAAARGWPVVATYGLTEACAQVATQPSSLRFAARPGCGPPLDGVAVRIDDDGTIALRGPTRMRGYLGASGPGDLDDGCDADGWLRTSDLGRIDGEGHLHVLGRRDDVVISGGENVYPGEVEAAFLDHPAVAAICVVGVPDPTWGARPAALIVPSDAAMRPAADTIAPAPDALVAQLDDHASTRLASFKRPVRWWLTAALPTRGIGKLDRRAVAARLRVRA